jgi:hypothetical protein
MNIEVKRTREAAAQGLIWQQAMAEIPTLS